nr:MAG TPA_asm: hypothetical protein [Caudoviricetes sp.]
MRNKHPGCCYCCKKWVARGEGRVETFCGRSRVIHIECSQNKSQERGSVTIALKPFLKSVSVGNV